MDSVTHILSGVVIHQSLTKKYRYYFLLVLSIIAANFPDIDFIFSLFSKNSILLGHRAFTHTLFFAPLFAFLFAFLFYKRKIKKSLDSPWTFQKIFFYFLFIFLVHLFLDFITTYGMYALLPFSYERYSLPILFIIDPFLWAILILSLLFSKKFGTKATRTGLALLFIYPLFSYGIQIILEKNMTQKYAPLLGENAVIDLVPTPLSPIHWKVIVEEGDKLHMGEINLTSLSSMPRLQTFDKIDPILWKMLADTNIELKRYTQLALYPAVSIEKQGDFEIFTITPLRYTPSSTTPKFARRKLFTMKIQKKDDTIIAYQKRERFLNGSKKWVYLPKKENAPS